MINTRAISAQVICKILQRQTSLMHLEDQLQKYQLSTQDRAFIQMICYGVCRHYYLLESFLKPHLQKKTKLPLRSLLLVGLYQLKYLDQPHYAVINETVSACKILNIHWAKNLVNAILRKLSAQSLDEASQLAEARYSFPNWMFKIIKEAYPLEWREILNASNQHPPMFIRTNAKKISASNYQATLAQNSIASTLIKSTEHCISLDKPIPITQLPDFENGVCSVQDFSAQLASEILAPYIKENVLDACAAPGGKTLALLEQTSAHVTAIDNHLLRLDKIKQNAQRVFPNTDRLTLLHASAEHTTEWAADHTTYDAVLLDAPCSATGVIRRHPDIKLLRTEEEILAIVQQQKILLKNLWDLVKPGGYMLYATCSILPVENTKQIESFIKNNTNATIIEIPKLKDIALKTDYGYQILPKIGDGFFYCLLRKEAIKKE